MSLKVLNRVINSLGNPFKVHTSREVRRHASNSYRAVLYVPGNDQKKIRKAETFAVDCIALDCEDGVAINKKDEARENIRCQLDKDKPVNSSAEIAVRVNSVGSGLCTQDVETILAAKTLPSTILLPKVETGDELHTFSEAVWQAMLKRPEEDRGPIKLIMLIESARAIMTLPELCLKAEQLATMAPVLPIGLILGSDDLVADLGATRTKSSLEILYARQRLVLVAKAFRLLAIDMVHIDYRNLDDLQRESEEGAIMGFNGKQVINPIQIPIVQDAFKPSKATVEWATGLIAEFEENQKKGMGAFTYRGSMIDMPTVRQAQNIINSASRK